MTVGMGYTWEILTKVVCKTMGMGLHTGAFNQGDLWDDHGYQTIHWSLVKSCLYK